MLGRNIDRRTAMMIILTTKAVGVRLSTAVHQELVDSLLKVESALPVVVDRSEATYLLAGSCRRRASV